MTFFTDLTNLPLILLQSNEVISEVIRTGAELEPQWDQYQGFIGFFAKFFLVLIHMIGNFIKNYGFAIVLTAVMVRLMLLPLTRVQIRAMRSMQMLQPVMKAIQRYYPDKSDQSAKTMELYQRYKINPFASCLPLIIQFPILFGVYRALYDPIFAGKDFLGIQLLFPVNVTSGRSFGLGPELHDLIDITVAVKGLQWTLFQLPEGLPMIGGSVWYWPALILVVFYIGSTIIMQKVMKKANSPNKDFIDEFNEIMNKGRKVEEKKTPDVADQMGKQMWMFNIIIILFAFIFSAGALLYFIIQNIIMMLEYTYLPKLAKATGPEMDPRELRKFILEAPAPAARPGATPNPPAKNPKEGGSKNKPSQEDAGTGADEQLPSDKVRRPRKKRRKK